MKDNSEKIKLPNFKVVGSARVEKFDKNYKKIADSCSGNAVKQWVLDKMRNASLNGLAGFMGRMNYNINNTTLDLHLLFKYVYLINSEIVPTSTSEPVFPDSNIVVSGFLDRYNESADGNLPTLGILNQAKSIITDNKFTFSYVWGYGSEIVGFNAIIHSFLTEAQLQSVDTQAYFNDVEECLVEGVPLDDSSNNWFPEKIDGVTYIFQVQAKIEGFPLKVIGTPVFSDNEIVPTATLTYDVDSWSLNTTPVRMCIKKDGDHIVFMLDDDIHISEDGGVSFMKYTVNNSFYGFSIDDSYLYQFDGSYLRRWNHSSKEEAGYVPGNIMPVRGEVNVFYSLTTSNKYILTEDIWLTTHILPTATATKYGFIDNPKCFMGGYAYARGTFSDYKTYSRGSLLRHLFPRYRCAEAAHVKLDQVTSKSADEVLVITYTFEIL